MKLDKFSPLGSHKIEESETSPLTALQLWVCGEGTQMARRGGGGGGRLPLFGRLPSLIVSPVQLYQIEFHCAIWALLLILMSLTLKQFA